MVAIIFFSACTKEDFYYVKYDANVVLNDGEELGIIILPDFNTGA